MLALHHWEPNGTIPAKVHDDLVPTESTAIMEYVDAAFDGPAVRQALATSRSGRPEQAFAPGSGHSRRG